MRKTLTDSEKLDWLQLIRTQNIGPVTFYRLIKKFGSAATALEALPEFSRKSGRKVPLVPYDRSAAEEEFKRAWHKGVIITALCEPEYPNPLRNITDPPPIIFTQGHISLFEKPAVAIIGARNASGIGRKFARQLASDLGEAGMVIVSGLARGIDGAAHSASLASGTIAVVAGGLDYIYPPEHEALTRDITHQGLILSERPLGAEPTARDFPRRNRLISGLSRGVVIVEAAAKSGTLITARYALEQGREVFAVPGSPLDPRSHGANRLIRDGATLVERADDILDVLAAQNRHIREGDLFDDHSDDVFGQMESHSSSDQPAIAKELLIKTRQDVLEFLGFSPIHRDEILREINAPAGIIADALMELVLSGEAEETGGGMFTRTQVE